VVFNDGLACNPTGLAIDPCSCQVRLRNNEVTFRGGAADTIQHPAPRFRCSAQLLIARHIQSRQLWIIDRIACSARLSASSGNRPRSSPTNREPFYPPCSISRAKADAAMTFDAQTDRACPQLAKGDRSMIAHSRNPYPASASTSAISHFFFNEPARVGISEKDVVPDAVRAHGTRAGVNRRFGERPYRLEGADGTIHNTSSAGRFGERFTAAMCGSAVAMARLVRPGRSAHPTGTSGSRHGVQSDRDGCCSHDSCLGPALARW
jgi:hypothetical protein